MVSNSRIVILIAGLIGVVQGQYLNTTAAIVTPITPDGQRHSSTCEPQTVTITSSGGGYGYGSCPTQTITSTQVSVSTTTCWETTTIE